jgi:hypothetical protein
MNNKVKLIGSLTTRIKNIRITKNDAELRNIIPKKI